jgi:outer membrane protein TolC
MLWEIDLFGGIRRQVQAAEADLTAQQEDRRNVMVSLLGDVATNYAQIRGYQLRLDIARHNIAIQEDTLKLTRNLVNAGQATERDVAQSEPLLETCCVEANLCINCLPQRSCGLRRDSLRT